jgi:hypothetical protein
MLNFGKDGSRKTLHDISGVSLHGGCIIIEANKRTRGSRNVRAERSGILQGLGFWMGGADRASPDSLASSPPLRSILSVFLTFDVQHV